MNPDEALADSVTDMQSETANSDCTSVTDTDEQLKAAAAEIGAIHQEMKLQHWLLGKLVGRGPRHVQLGKMTHEEKQEYLSNKFYSHGFGGENRPGCWQLQCLRCDKLYFTGHRRAKYCSAECRKAAAKERYREQIEKARQKICVHCQKPFTAKRADARTCRNQCRQAAYREAKIERAVLGSGVTPAGNEVAK